MTDAREIIAQVFRRAHRDACYPDASTGECEIAASAIAAALTAAGFRILGPDEVDPVTVERCAAEIQTLKLMLLSQSVILDIDRDVAVYNIAIDAIRAIGRKA